jgi:hypothetical protein
MRCKQSQERLGPLRAIQWQNQRLKIRKLKATELQTDVGKPFKTPNIVMENTAILPSVFYENVMW